MSELSNIGDSVKQAVTAAPREALNLLSVVGSVAGKGMSAIGDAIFTPAEAATRTVIYSNGDIGTRSGNITTRSNGETDIATGGGGYIDAQTGQYHTGD